MFPVLNIILLNIIIISNVYEGFVEFKLNDMPEA